MTDLETDLRSWMQERATRVHASPAILQTDYRPRTRGWWPRTRGWWLRSHGWRPRLAIGGAVAAAAGTLTAVLSLAGGASTAFAGWSAQPTTPSASQLQTANSYCNANIPNPNATTQQLVDSRGPYTIMVYAGAAGATQTYNFCTVGPSFRNASGWTSYPPVTPDAGKLFLWVDHTSYDDGQPYGTMIASAGAGVTGANLTLSDGTVVTATVQNGYVAAWWPGATHIASAELATTSGTHTQTFNYPCDVQSCTGGPHGGR